MSFVRQARADEFLQEASTDRIETRLQEKQNTCQALFRDRGAHARRFHCQPPAKRKATDEYIRTRSIETDRQKTKGRRSEPAFIRTRFFLKVKQPGKAGPFYLDAGITSNKRLTVIIVIKIYKTTAQNIKTPSKRNGISVEYANKSFALTLF